MVDGGTMRTLPTLEAITTTRLFSADDLTFLNRMTTTGQILPSVAHELNNTLQIVAGLVEILMLRGQLAPDALDKIQKIGEQANKAAGQLRDLVSFTRRDGTARKVDVRAALDRALAFRRYHLSRGRMNVTIDAPEGAALIARADSQYVSQVLLNLVLNAEEALASCDSREILVTLARDRGRIRCEVRDSGSGLSDEAEARAGEPFYTTKERGGAGLGLAVARLLAERDDGRLEVLTTSPMCVQVEWPAES
jgi:C4-dicarboxylate-specific signal transduction histidine kinase